MIQITKLKCIRCGHIFIHTQGGITVNNKHPQCPKCGSILTIHTTKDIKKAKS